MRLSSSLAIFEIQASKLKTSELCAQEKPASPECCVYPETSTMAPFTALLTLELPDPLGIHELRRATEGLAVHGPPRAVKTADVRALCPGENYQLRMLCLS